MLLRSSISTTKKFFQKTLETFKSFLSGDGTYEKLPKSPFPFPDGAIHNPNNVNYKELDKFYTDFTAQWDGEKAKSSSFKKRSNKKRDNNLIINNSTQLNLNPRQGGHDTKGHYRLNDSAQLNPSARQGGYHDTKGHQNRPRGRVDQDTQLGHHHNESNGANANSDDEKRKRTIAYNAKKKKKYEEELREGRRYVVAQKIKELKMIDKRNEEHVLDVEEVVHYYSRLTCPAFLDIVDKFFMEIYSELFTINQSSSSIASHPFNNISRSGD